MTLIFDQNVSFRIIHLIAAVFPHAKQVRELQLDNASDIAIWNYAKENDLCIVTFDADFIDISALRGFPPKVIWLRLGNTSTTNIAEKLIQQSERINSFLEDKEIAFLEIR